MELDTSSRSEQRKFGILMGIVIPVFGLIRWAFHSFEGYPHWAWFAIAAPFLVLGIVAPRVLEPVLVVWMKFALALNWLVTRVLLTITWVFLVTPTRLGVLCFGEDPLKRAWLPDAETYWEEPEEQPDSPERYTQQF